MNENPEIAGPAADLIKIEEGPTTDSIAEAPTGPAEQFVIMVGGDAAPDNKQNGPPSPDPSFPFGHPDNMDWQNVDPAGINLLHEINSRAWMKSTEYCSGHPLDRNPNEQSELYPYATGENVYKSIYDLDMAFVKGLINETYFKYRKTELRTAGATRFYLNVNVYNLGIFLEWTRLLSIMVLKAMNSSLYPLIVRLNPIRPGINFTLAWDYWTLDEREMIHALIMTSLNNIPV